jgi:hypothetical protein
MRLNITAFIINMIILPSYAFSEQHEFPQKPLLYSGEYFYKIVILDSDEKYPVDITLKSLDEKIVEAHFNYYTYSCEAVSESLSVGQNFILIQEKVTKGKERCFPSSYNFTISQFSGSPSQVTKIVNITDGTVINTDIIESKIQLTEKAKERVKYFAGINSDKYHNNLNKGTFVGYISAYNISGFKKDIQSANRLAKTKKQKAKIEELLVQKLGPENVFDFTLTEESSSKLKDFKSSGLFFSGHAGLMRTYFINVKAKPKKNLPFPLKYNSYQVKVIFSIELCVHPGSMQKLFKTIYSEYVFNLVKEKNWTDSYKLEENIPIAGKLKDVWLSNPMGNQYSVKEFRVESLTVSPHPTDIKVIND